MANSLLKTRDYTYARLQLNQDKSKCRALGPMYGEIKHKTMMISGKTKIFQRDLFEKIRFSPPRSCRLIMTRKAKIINLKF